MPDTVLPPVTWFQDPAEFTALLDLFRAIERAKLAQPMRVLEIGSFYGGTLWQWIDNLQPGALVVSVDVTIPEKDPRYQDVLHAQKLWQGWADERRVKLIRIPTNSTWRRTVKQVSAYAPFDFIFVDGGHEYETVSADFSNYYAMLRPDGAMAFHDIAHEADPGVMRFWHELKERRTGRGMFEIMLAPPDTWGIGVIRR